MKNNNGLSEETAKELLRILQVSNERMKKMLSNISVTPNWICQTSLTIDRLQNCEN